MEFKPWMWLVLVIAGLLMAMSLVYPITGI